MPNTNPLLASHCFTNDSLHNPIPTQLNGQVWSKIETAVKPFKTFDTTTTTGSFNDSGIIGVEATLSTNHLSKKERDYAVTSFYALGGGALPLALPSTLQDYASPSPYVFSGDLTLTFKDNELVNISSVPITPLMVSNNSVNPSFSAPIVFNGLPFEFLLNVSSSRDSNCDEESYGAVGYNSDNLLVFCILKPQYTAQYTFEVVNTLNLGFLDNFTSTELVWLNSRTCLFSVQGQTTVYLITINDDASNITFKTFSGDSVLYTTPKKDFIFGNEAVVVVRFDPTSGFKVFAISDFGEQLLYTGDGIFVALYKVDDFTAIAIKDTLNNSVSINVLQNWVNPCNTLISSNDLTVAFGTNWQGEGTIVYEGIVYILIRYTGLDISRFALIRVSDGYTIAPNKWVFPFPTTSLMKAYAGAAGITLACANLLFVLRYETDSRASLSALDLQFEVLNSLTSSFVFNGLPYVSHGLETRLVNTLKSININNYYRCIRNIQQAPFSTNYGMAIAPYSGIDEYYARVYVGYPSCYHFDLTPYAGIRFNSFSGFIKRGDKLYGVFLTSIPYIQEDQPGISNVPVIVEPLNNDIFDDFFSGLDFESLVLWSPGMGLEAHNTSYKINNIIYSESRFQVIANLTGADGGVYQIIGYANIYLGHTGEWLTDRLNYSQSLALMAGDKYHAERLTSFDIPIVGVYSLNPTSNVDLTNLIFEYFIPCIDSQTISLHSDLTVDETQFEGKWTSLENAGERSLSSLSPRLNILANQSMFLGMTNIYDTLKGNVFRYD